MNLFESEYIVESRFFTSILVRLRLKLFSVMNKANEWILLSKGIAIIFKEIRLLNLDLNVTVFIDLVGSHF